jgi:hypothetical protein
MEKRDKGTSVPGKEKGLASFCQRDDSVSLTPISPGKATHAERLATAVHLRRHRQVKCALS